MDRVFCLSRVTKFIAPAITPSSYVWSDRLVVFASGSASLLGILFSQIHEVWVRKNASTFETRLTYTPSDAFETLPFPAALPEELGLFANRFADGRDLFCRAMQIGLTDVYNRFHTDSERDPRIEGLRALQRELDAAVARAYGWHDLDLEHGFHKVPYLPENDRVRFTISENARVEVLRRLSALNRQRYEEEVARGLHADATPRISTRVTRASRATNAAMAQSSLDFEDGATTIANGETPSSAILNFLSTRDGWHAKADILIATGITDGQWNAAIADLIAGGKAERQGERRGARYRFLAGKEE